MTKIWFYSTRSQAFSLLALITAFVLFVSVGSFFVVGISVSYSIVMGGLVSILPNLCFTWLFFREMKPSAAKRIVRAFYVGECTKLLLIAVLFAIAISFLNVIIVPFFVGLFIAQMGFFLAPVLFMKKR